jgi:hypothetical protein
LFWFGRLNSPVGLPADLHSLNQPLWWRACTGVIGYERRPILEVRMDKLLDELGADFKEAWDSAESIDPASEDGKALHGALDELSGKCPQGT